MKKQTKEQQIAALESQIAKEQTYETPDEKYIQKLRLDLYYLKPRAIAPNPFVEQLAATMKEQAEIDAERFRQRQESNSRAVDSYGNPFVWGKVYGE